MTAYRITADNVLSEHGAAILDLAAGDVCFLNPAAGRILAALAGGSHDSDVVANIAASTGAHRHQVEHDVQALVAGLIHRGILAAVPARSDQGGGTR